MGVSINEGGGNVDLDAIVAGGDAFLARIKTLKEAKEDADASLAALKLGTDLAAKQREVQEHEQAALQKVQDAKSDAATLVEQGRADAAALKRQAQVEADELLAKARGQASTLSTEVANAQQVLSVWAEKTKSEADDYMTRATDAKNEAEKQLELNVQAAKDLAKDRKQAQQALADANALQVTLTAKLDAIKAAAS